MFLAPIGYAAEGSKTRKCDRYVARQSRTYQEGEVSHEKMRARTRLLAALHSKNPEAIKQAKADAIKAGYSAEAVGHIGRTPSDVFLFSKLTEADQQAILRQANNRPIRRSSSGISGTPK